MPGLKTANGDVRSTRTHPCRMRKRDNLRPSSESYRHHALNGFGMILLVCSKKHVEACQLPRSKSFSSAGSSIGPSLALRESLGEHRELQQLLTVKFHCKIWVRIDEIVKRALNRRGFAILKGLAR